MKDLTCFYKRDVVTLVKRNPSAKHLTSLLASFDRVYHANKKNCLNFHFNAFLPSSLICGKSLNSRKKVQTAERQNKPLRKYISVRASNENRIKKQSK